MHHQGLIHLLKSIKHDIPEIENYLQQNYSSHVTRHLIMHYNFFNEPPYLVDTSYYLQLVQFLLLTSFSELIINNKLTNHVQKHNLSAKASRLLKESKIHFCISDKHEIRYSTESPYKQKQEK